MPNQVVQLLRRLNALRVTKEEAIEFKWLKENLDEALDFKDCCFVYWEPPLDKSELQYEEKSEAQSLGESHWRLGWSALFKRTYPALSKLTIAEVLRGLHSGYVIGEHLKWKPEERIGLTLEQAVAIEKARAKAKDVKQLQSLSALSDLHWSEINRAYKDGYVVTSKT